MGVAHPNADSAFIDICHDGQTDIDDAIGNAVTLAGLWTAAALRSDLGDPDTCRQAAMVGPRKALAQASPLTTGGLVDDTNGRPAH